MSNNSNPCKCLRCNYTWDKRKDGRPKACPECKRRDWDKVIVKTERALSV